MGERLDVLDRHMGATVNEGADFGAQDQVLAGPQAGAPTDPFVGEVRRGVLMRPRRGGQSHGVADEVLGDGDLAHEVMESEHILA